MSFDDYCVCGHIKKYPEKVCHNCKKGIGMKEKIVDTILKVSLRHHNDITSADENAAADAADIILNEYLKLTSASIQQTIDKDGECYYCHKKTNSLSCNPSEWAVFLCHADAPGKVQPHHVGCVMKRVIIGEHILSETDYKDEYFFEG